MIRRALLRILVSAVLWLVAALMVGCAAPHDDEVPSIERSAVEPQVAQAIDLARAAVVETPGSVEAWGRLGQLFQAHDLQADATRCYVRAMELDANDYRWPYLAALALRADDVTASLPMFRRAAETSPSSSTFYVAYAEALLQAGDVPGAAEQYRRAMARSARSSHALLGLAQVELTSGDADEALEHLLDAIRIAPRHGEVHSLLAQIYHRRGESELATRAERLAAAYPASPRPPDPVVAVMQSEDVSSHGLSRRGLQLAVAGRFVEAEALFRRVLELRQGIAADHANLGGVLTRQGKLDEAIEEIERGLALAPENANLLNNLASAELASGDLEAAEEHLRAAAVIDPGVAGTHFNLGLVRYRQGRIEQAIEDYEQAIALEPAYIEVYVNLGVALASAGREHDAIRRWREALELDPRAAAARYLLAQALVGRSAHREAVQLLDEGTALADDDPQLASLLAWELASAPEPDLRDGDRAVDLARRILRAFPDQPDSADLLGAALAEAGNFNEAIRTAESARNLARNAGNAELADAIGRRIEGYRRGRAYRQN